MSRQSICGVGPPERIGRHRVVRDPVPLAAVRAGLGRGCEAQERQARPARNSAVSEEVPEEPSDLHPPLRGENGARCDKIGGREPLKGVLLLVANLRRKSRVGEEKPHIERVLIKHSPENSHVDSSAW